jgi:hypothetical protein
MEFEKVESKGQKIRGKGATFWVPLAVEHELVIYDASLGF